MNAFTEASKVALMSGVAEVLTSDWLIDGTHPAKIVNITNNNKE
tara:strand:+ start:541 stop:672 length:132 start_codon:yes stop_codon:yes gene_type:complete